MSTGIAAGNRTPDLLLMMEYGMLYVSLPGSLFSCATLTLQR